MADLTLNEKISAWFTPTEYWDTHCRRCHWTFRADGEGCRPDGYCSFVGDLPKTPDYLHDEAANARLLDILRDAHFKQVEADFASPFYTLCINLMNHYGDRKQFVVDAFCKWAGIPVEEKVHG